MIYKNSPDNFSLKFGVVSCYVECDDRILLLHRHEHKPQGNKWGVPAGKIDVGESEVEAMVRELYEETGIELKPSNLEYLDKVFVRYSDYDFVYHMFRARLSSLPKVITADKEHKGFCWQTPAEALKMILVDDLDACIKLSYKI